MSFRDEVLAAQQRIADLVRMTPLEHSPVLSELAGCRVHLKLENFQRTGSFKLRGATNLLTSLDAETRARGVVAASTGNHGAATACASASLGCPCIVYVPEGAAASKIAAIRSYGAEVREHGDDGLLAELAARELATSEGMTYVSPYNDSRVIAGQGTVGAEIDEQLESVDAVVVAVGGGGLIAGIGGFLNAVRPGCRIVACSPRNSAVLYASLEAGEIVDRPSLPTLSDGTAGGVEPGAITLERCREVIDDFYLVEEPAIREAVRLVIGTHHMLVEGAAGVAVAACLAHREQFAGQEVVIVLCGANIDPDVLAEVL